MSGTITQPPRLDPKLRNLAGRRALIGKTLDDALYATRGYPTDVVYVTDPRKLPTLKRRKGTVLLFVEDKTNVVKGVR